MIELPDKLWERPWDYVNTWSGGEPVKVSIEAIPKERLQLDWIIDVFEQIVQKLNKEEK